VDVNPYIDLIHVTYGLIQSRYTAAGKHIPFALFQYYCVMFWWMRVLFLFKSSNRPIHQVISKAPAAKGKGLDYRGWHYVLITHNPKEVS